MDRLAWQTLSFWRRNCAAWFGKSLRSLDARDLHQASGWDDAEGDPSTALNGVEAFILGVDRLSDDLDNAIDDGQLENMAVIVSQYARMGISNGASPRDVAGAIKLQDLETRRRNYMVAQKVDPNNRQPGLEARLAAFLGQRIPVLGLFSLTSTADGAVVDVTQGPAALLEVDDWFDAVSRVRPEIGKLAAVGLIGELMGAAGLALRAGRILWILAKVGRPLVARPGPDASRLWPLLAAPMAAG